METAVVLGLMLAGIAVFMLLIGIGNAVHTAMNHEVVEESEEEEDDEGRDQC